MAGVSIEALKAELRKSALARRDALPEAERQAAAGTIAMRPFPVSVAPGMVVSGYLPIRSEINPLPLLRRLAEAGARLALPVMQGREQPLLMRAYAFGDPLNKGMWGIREPLAAAAELDPDILLVPLAAFDRAGHRLGYGGGYYDRTIARLRSRKPVVAVGLAYAVQEVAAVPVTARDAPLDLVLTEQGAIECSGT